MYNTNIVLYLLACSYFVESANSNLDSGSGYTSNCNDSCLPFLDLKNSNMRFTGVDDATAMVALPSPMKYGNATYRRLYINSNGVIGFGVSNSSPSPATFPVPRLVVAPYWTDIDLSSVGSIDYTTITANSSLSNLLDMVNAYISRVVNIEFHGQLMLVVIWNGVCPFGDQNCNETNTFQVVLVTNGNLSYTVFTYKCGELNWNNGHASIGFSSNGTLFANHPLSRQSNVNDIACINTPSTPWSNVVYQISTGCSNPDFPSSGIDGLSVSFPNTNSGTTALYSCDTGYTLIGNSTRVCQTNGTWSGTPPHCQQVHKPTNRVITFPVMQSKVCGQEDPKADRLLIEALKHVYV